MPPTRRDAAQPYQKSRTRRKAEVLNQESSPPPPTHKNNFHDTPHGPKNSHPPLTHNWENTVKLKGYIAAELDKPGATVAGGPEYTAKLFEGIVKEQDIKAFISKPEYFNNGRWVAIPLSIGKEKELYEPLTKIANAIMEHFSYERREVVASFNTMLSHDAKIASNSNFIWGEDKDWAKLKSAPDIMIVGKDEPFFKTSSSPKHAAYIFCISLLEVKQNIEEGLSKNENRNQMALYVRECDVQQIHREFVYCGLIDGNNMRVFQFDRCGVIYTDAVNYHEDPEMFVRWICGLGSNKMDKVGFDTSIKWRQAGANKYSLTMPKIHTPIQLPDSSLISQSLTLTGRGTACWRGTLAGTSTSVIIKQQWRHVHRTSEGEFLRSLEGIKGVAQLLSELVGKNVSAHRWVPQPHLFQDRQFTRLAIHYEGKIIEHAKSQLQLLRCLRDAVKGHRNAWNANILHRDIHPGNILLGSKDTLGGYYGVITDFDMAIYINRTESLSDHDFRSGDRTFQSTGTVLNPLRPHDHIDDLESFFWVLAWISIKYVRPGIAKKFPSNLLSMWSDENARLGAFERRYAMEYCSQVIIPLVGNRFGSSIRTLLVDLAQWLWNKSHDRVKPYDPEPDHPKTVEALCPDAQNDYEEYLAMINRAIRKAKWEDKQMEENQQQSGQEIRTWSDTMAQRSGTGPILNPSHEGAESGYGSDDPDTEVEVIESSESFPQSNGPSDTTEDDNGSAPDIGNELQHVAPSATVATADDAENHSNDEASEDQTTRQSPFPTTPLPRTHSPPSSRATSTTTEGIQFRKRQHSMMPTARADKRSRTADEAHAIASSPFAPDSVHRLVTSPVAVASTPIHDNLFSPPSPLTPLPSDFAQLEPTLPSPSGAFLTSTDRTRSGAPRYGPVETGITSHASTVHSSPLRGRGQTSQFAPVSIGLLSGVANAFPNHLAGPSPHAPPAATEPDEDALIQTSSPLSSVPSSSLPDIQLGSLSPLSSLPPSSPSVTPANRAISHSPWPDYDGDSSLGSVPLSQIPSNATSRASSRRASIDGLSTLSSIPEADEDIEEK